MMDFESINKKLGNIAEVKAYAKHTAIAADIAAEIEKETEPATEQQAAGNKTPAGMGTQGRKGQKLARYNLGLTAENKEFIQIYANATGQTQNALINSIIGAYRREHPDAVAAVAKARAAWDIITEE